MSSLSSPRSLMSPGGVLDQPSTGRLDLSDDEQDDETFDNEGDYSSRMGEFLSDNDDDSETEDDLDVEFVYTGVDTQASGGNYRDQIRDVLGLDHEEESEVIHAESAGHTSMLLEKKSITAVPDSTPGDGMSEGAPSPSREFSFSSIVQNEGVLASEPHQVLSKFPNPYLHPTTSRLRSYVSQPSSMHPGSSAGKLEGVSPSPSHFSAISRTSSHSNLRTSANGTSDREVFQWNPLHAINDTVYTSKQKPPKAAVVLSSVLGDSLPDMGSPTVLAANGMICIGTSAGRVYVFNFRQILRCICGGEDPAGTLGAVTAIALSYDHTFLAVGHITGHIQLFDLSDPKKPARHVAPTILAAVNSGRKEGHLQGSRIISIGFVGRRHTAIVSADDQGLAFYHSLGKMLFIDAPDILRILGKYPSYEGLDPSKNSKRAPETQKDSMSSSSLSSPLAENGHKVTPTPRRKPRYTILAVALLPLGAVPHPTDAYNIIALLTPAKLVMVGLQPAPRTLCKLPRETYDGNILTSKSMSRVKGALVWFPSVPHHVTEGDMGNNSSQKQTTPTLAYSWGNALYLIRVSEHITTQRIQNPRTGRVSDVKVGTVGFEALPKYKLANEEDILALQWLNAHQIVVITNSTLQMYDVRISTIIECVQFDALSLVSYPFRSTGNGAVSHTDSIGEIAHSVRVYKGKIFLLRLCGVEVGILLTWADRILSSVQSGDFLGAIELARLYYTGNAPGNMNGLPEEIQMRRKVVGARMRDLMVASMRYAFSEDRMTDGTHVTPDGRGVDRTSLFEHLVATCARACIALDDLELLFEDLFQHYDDHGISRIFLMQLEPFILDNQIRQVPPRITQRLVAMHDQEGQPALVERVIWHIDPLCLDINQAIHLCQQHQLYDALIYVYNRAMNDFVSPVVELLGLIRRVLRYRKSRMEGVNGNGENADDAAIEAVILNAYKIYPYLANVLTGLSYPSEHPLGEDEALQAKKDVYKFLFSGRSSVWPMDETGRLVLTSDEECGVEPTFPYVRTLLRFDAECFLHTLDYAFEDSYLNDETQSVTRLVIVKTLLEILASQWLPQATVIFVNIFVARNVPKYPQFIQIAPSALHKILIGLAEDPEPSTREDRQLATEYLLSVYTPHDNDRILTLFDAAGFFRILRSWHKQDRHWASLLSTYMRDPDLRVSETFEHIDDVMSTSTRLNDGVLPREVRAFIANALPQLLLICVTRTASLVDKHYPELHQQAIDALSPIDDRKCFSYLHHLLGPTSAEEDEYVTSSRQLRPSRHLPKGLRQFFVTLHCRYQPGDVVDALKHLPSDDLDWVQVLQACEDNGIYGAVIWGLNWKGDICGALSKVDAFEKRISSQIVTLLGSAEPSDAGTAVERALRDLESVGWTGMAVCLEQSQNSSMKGVSLEDLWFQLLLSQIISMQKVAACGPEEAYSNQSIDESQFSPIHRHTLSSLRKLIREIFASLITVSSVQALSFPRLFKRLVDSAAQSHTSVGATYTEFRAILMGMLESYRSEGDMLIITKHLIDRDLFETVEVAISERGRGWAPSASVCSICRQSLFDLDCQHGTKDAVHKARIVISRVGTIFHQACMPTPT